MSVKPVQHYSMYMLSYISLRCVVIRLLAHLNSVSAIYINLLIKK